MGIYSREEDLGKTPAFIPTQSRMERPETFQGMLLILWQLSN
jgi:hypothetical protein